MICLEPRCFRPWLIVLAGLAGCASTPLPADSAAAPLARGTVAGAPTTKTMPADAFLAALASHCGKAYAGRIVANTPAPATPDAFAGKALVMHVRGCVDPLRGLRIPFHVGDDRSRTWLLMRTDTGLRLKHDHRHSDGSPDAVTMYGGDTVTPGTPRRQEFPVDAESIAMFQVEGLTASVTNTWAMEVEPGKHFVYELSRPGGRLFRVEFDLTAPIEPPPPPWGDI